MQTLQKPNRLFLVLEEKKANFFAAGIALVLITFFSYLPAIKCRYVWDDDTHLTKNIVLQENGLYRSWFTKEQRMYWPVTWTSFWLEHQIWGLNPLGYHVVNILLHTLCVLLIWRLLVRLKIPGAWLAALIFGLNPVNVESVAWITQRKNLLSMLFFLTALLMYVRFDENGNRKLYWLAVLSFLLGMLSKGAIVPLPVVILMLVLWLHDRISGRDILRSLPFFAVSFIMGSVEVWFQSVRVVGEEVVSEGTLFERIARAGWVVWFYLYKLLLPLNLCFVYPRWKIDGSNWLSYVPIVSLIIILVLFWRYRRSWGRPLFFALAYFVVMVGPAMGFAKFYFLKFSYVADHYQYMATIGPIALVAGAVVVTLKRFGRILKTIGTIVVICVLAVLAILTWKQTHIYKDSKTIWYDTIGKNPNAAMAYNNLGAVLYSEGKTDEAVECYNKAVEIQPDYAKPYYNLAGIFARRGQIDKSIEYYQKSLAASPNYYQTHNKLGIVLLNKGRTADAIVQFREALRLNPGFSDAYLNLGVALLNQGNNSESVRYLEILVKHEPKNAEGHYYLGTALAKQKNYDDEAIEHLKFAINSSENAKAAKLLAEIYFARGKFEETFLYWGKALEIEPNQPDVLNDMAWLEATHKNPKLRNPQEAVELATRACALTNNQNPALLDTLAVSYAAAGSFQRAIETSEKALELAKSSLPKQTVEKMREHLDLFQAGKPYVEP
jgi:tetratricopeptide (TPR) repeat protein